MYYDVRFGWVAGARPRRLSGRPGLSGLGLTASNAAIRDKIVASRGCFR